MSKKPGRLLEQFFALKSALDQHKEFQDAVRTIYRKRLITRKSWNEAVVPAENSWSRALDEAFKKLHHSASKHGFPHDLIREEEVMERLNISQKSLYRRRKKRELAYVKDKEGIVWYSVLDLIEYLRETRCPSLKPHPGRPRKF